MKRHKTPFLHQVTCAIPHQKPKRVQNKCGCGAMQSPAPGAPRPAARPPRRTLAAVHGAVEQEGAAQPGYLQRHQPRHQPPPHGRRSPRAALPVAPVQAAHAQSARPARCGCPCVRIASCRLRLIAC